MLSLARIPWKKGFFPGFLAFFKLNGRLYRYATYNRSKISQVQVEDDVVRVEMINREYKLNLKVYRKSGGVLKAPRHGSMDREIGESIISSMDLELRDRHGHLLYGDRALHTGLEIVGNVEQYFQNID